MKWSTATPPWLRLNRSTLRRTPAQRWLDATPPQRWYAPALRDARTATPHGRTTSMVDNIDATADPDRQHMCEQADNPAETEPCPGFFAFGAGSDTERPPETSTPHAWTWPSRRLSGGLPSTDTITTPPLPPGCRSAPCRGGSPMCGGHPYTWLRAIPQTRSYASPARQAARAGPDMGTPR